MSSAPPHTKAYLLKSRVNSWWVNVELELTDTTLLCVASEDSKWVDEELGLTFYLFGANEAENKAAIANVRRAYPALKIVGHSHGYLRGDALRAKVDEINALAPDFLWVALGVPYEQAFVDEFMSRLGNVGVIKTSGGLFNFLSGSRPRAPRWMQIVGLEWAWRLWLEPRRLFWRYLTTNPHALYLLFNRTRSSATRD